MTVRPSTRQDRYDWPVLAADNGRWLVECSCGAWAYGARRADVMEWGSEHKAERHPAPPAPVRPATARRLRSAPPRQRQASRGAVAISDLPSRVRRKLPHQRQSDVF